MRTRSGRRAVTLVEVALTAGFAALLLAMIAPALGTAREKARVPLCVDNLRQLAAGSAAYLQEFDSLSFALPYGYDGVTFNYYTEFITAGGMPDKTAAEWEGLADMIGGSAPAYLNLDTYRVRPRLRPLNAYLANDVSWDRPVDRRVAAGMEIPSLFRCPSDRTATVPTVGADNPVPPDAPVYRMWEFWGSSYPINWYWVYYYESTILRAGFIRTLGADDDGVGRGSVWLNEATGRHASELALFLEGQFNYAASGARPPGLPQGGGPWGNGPALELDGWHGRRNFHSAAFADGSARYARFDTRFLYGDGWTLWPRRPWLRPWSRYDGIDP